MEDTKTPVKTPTLAELIAQVVALTERVAQLETKSRGAASEREMTADDARRILTGDLKETPHRAAAETLKLSYGQIYSCRLEYTFKAVHAELRKEGFRNPWLKK